MDEYQDITLELEVLTVHDEPEVRAVLGPSGFLHNMPPEAEQIAQLLRLGGAVAFLALVIIWHLIRP
jgi:hypothetical protein